MRNVLRLTAAAVVAGVLGLVQVSEAQAARVYSFGRGRHHGRHHGHHGRRRHHGRRWRRSHVYYPTTSSHIYYNVPSTTTVFVPTPTYTYVEPSPNVAYIPAPVAAPSTAPTTADEVSPLSDRGMFQAVAKMLTHEFPGQVRRMKLKVIKGKVWIRGQVDSEQTKNEISEAIAKIAGVQKVDNDLDVTS